MSVFSWKQASQKASADTANLKTPAHSISHQEHPTLNVQRTIGNQAVLRRRQAEKGEVDVAASHPGFAYNFATIPVFHTPVRGIQRKLTVNAPGDAYEQEADRVSEQVMRMPAPQAAPTPQVSGRAAGVQRACACGGSCDNCKNKDHDEKHVKVQMKTAGPVNAGGMEAPPIVHEVLRSPGQPLDKATREFMEPRFGHDFSHVRVHTDAKAAESARVVGARAYTVGRDLVFAEGQFAPSTWRGRELLGHELTHNLQQAPIRSSLLQRQQGEPPGAFYDSAIYNSEPLNPKIQKNDVIDELKKKKKLKEITSYSVVGVKNDSVEEIFLLTRLFGWLPKRWNTEANLVMEIGWPKKPGEAAPKGRVSFRIDADGAATAELITAPALVVTTIKDAADKLKSDFGFSAVTGWSSYAELSTVLAALQMLKSRSPQDIAAFKGVELIKVAKIDPPPGEKGERCGEFFAQGRTLQPGAARSTTLKIAQCAFEASEHLFYPGKGGEGTLPGSFQIIFHEVGHAVENQKLREARADMDQASSEVAAAKEAIGKYGTDYDAAQKEAKKKGPLKKFYAEQEKIYKGLEQNENQAAQHKSRAYEALKRELPQTQRLVKFVNIAKKITPFTKYSTENWPQKPEEFYAEAYSLWLVHPEFLQRNYLPIFDFFENGDYRK